MLFTSKPMHPLVAKRRHNLNIYCFDKTLLILLDFNKIILISFYSLFSFY